MSIMVPVLYEKERGCGFRKEGGLYLVSQKGGRPCGRFPIPVSTCPTCGQGIKPSRGFTWVDGDALKASAPSCSHGRLGIPCLSCPMHPAHGENLGRTGLIWIGEKFYPTPVDFLLEADAMGTSRRITAVPRGLIKKNPETGDMELAPTWIFLAHRKAIVVPDVMREPHNEDKPPLLELPGIFAIWRPTAIQKVVSRETPEEELEKLVKRGIKPVIVKRQQAELFPEEEKHEALG